LEALYLQRFVGEGQIGLGRQKKRAGRRQRTDRKEDRRVFTGKKEKRLLIPDTDVILASVNISNN